MFDMVCPNFGWTPVSSGDELVRDYTRPKSVWSVGN